MLTKIYTSGRACPTWSLWLLPLGFHFQAAQDYTRLLPHLKNDLCLCLQVLNGSKMFQVYIDIYIGWSNSGMTKLPGRGFSRNPEQTTPSWNRNMHRQFTSTVIQSFLHQSWLWDQWWHRLSNLSNFPLATRNRRPSETYWNSLWACSNPLGQEYMWSIWISHWILLIFIEASGAAMAGKATCSFLGKTSWWSCEARKPRDPLADRSWDWRDPFRWVDRGSRPTSQGPWAFMDEEWMINEFDDCHPLSSVVIWAWINTY